MKSTFNSFIFYNIFSASWYYKEQAGLWQFHKMSIISYNVIFFPPKKKESLFPILIRCHNSAAFCKKSESGTEWYKVRITDDFSNTFCTYSWKKKFENPKEFSRLPRLIIVCSLTSIYIRNNLQMFPVALCETWMMIRRNCGPFFPTKLY